MRKLKLSHKDYLLAIGILVAVIVLLTTIVYTDVQDAELKNTHTPTPHKTGLTISPSVLLKKFVEIVDLNSLLHKDR